MSSKNGVLDNGILGADGPAWLHEAGHAFDDAAKTAVNNRVSSSPSTPEGSPPFRSTLEGSPPFQSKPEGSPSFRSTPEGSERLAGGQRPPENAASGPGDPGGVAAGSNARQDNEAAYKRDEAGRFSPGTKGGPGNPYNRQVAHLKKVLLASVTDDDITAIGQMLIRRAKEGNVAAARVLFTYILPKGPDPDRLDKHEWDTCAETKDFQRDIPSMSNTPHAEVLLEVVRAVRASLTDEIVHGVYAGLRATDKQCDKLFDMDPGEARDIFKKWGGMSDEEWAAYQAAEAEKKAKRRKRAK